MTTLYLQLRVSFMLTKQKGIFFTKLNVLAQTNSNLDYIQSLDLSEAGTLHVRDNGFRDFSQLNELNISNTRISMLKNNWFARSNNISMLDASWNKLTSVKREDLRTLSKLVMVNLSHNELEDIEMFAFSDLRRMIELNLRNNRIRNIIDWGDLPNLEVLNLDDNFLTEVSIITTIEGETNLRMKNPRNCLEC